ncbi:MAG TPA: hypothetical protein VIJ66_00925 [Solirubrobacteraceae bacterium]
MATTKKRTTVAKPASRANGRIPSNGYSTATSPGRIRSKARREAIEVLIERTTKGPGPTPEMEARLKDDAWGKRLVDP